MMFHWVGVIIKGKLSIFVNKQHCLGICCFVLVFDFSSHVNYSHCWLQRKAQTRCGAVWPIQLDSVPVGLHTKLQEVPVRVFHRLCCKQKKRHAFEISLERLLFQYLELMLENITCDCMHSSHSSPSSLQLLVCLLDIGLSEQEDCPS